VDVWAFEQSVDCRVSRDFAWRFWTKVSNWPVEKAQDYIAIVAPELERGIPQGMRKLAEAMEKAVSGHS